MEKSDNFFIASSKIFAIVITILFLFLAGLKITGHSVSSKTGLATTSLSGLTILFFIILLFLIKLRPKTYKP